MPDPRDPDPSRPPTPAAHRRLMEERVTFLYQTNLIPVLTGLLLAGLFGWLLWPYGPPWLVGGWVAVVALSQLARLGLLAWFRQARNAGPIPAPERWAHRQTVLHLIVGLAWGLGAGLIMPAAPVTHQATLILFFGGAATAGIFVALHLPAYLAYILGIVVPLILGVALLGPAESQLLTVLLVLYLLAAIGIGRQVARMVNRVFRLQIDNEQLVEELRRQATTDPLTGVANRREFLARLKSELSRARRSGEPLAVLGLDLDRFKAVNDHHGHPAGDALLLAVTGACQRVLRDMDCLGRMGGEEFAVLLPAASPEQAEAVAERVRRAVAEATVSDGGAQVGVTASIGAASAREAGYELSELLRLADARLYAAKRLGGDRWVAAGPATAESA